MSNQTLARWVCATCREHRGHTVNGGIVQTWVSGWEGALSHSAAISQHLDIHIMSIQSDLDAAANQQPQPTAAGERCRCDQEEGDSRCPGHPTCEECSEPAGPNYLCADHGTAAGEPVAETKVPHVHEWTTFVRNSDMQWCSCGAEKPYGRDRIMVPEARALEAESRNAELVALLRDTLPWVGKSQWADHNSMLDIRRRIATILRRDGEAGA